MFRAVCGFGSPEPGGYAAGMVFLPAGEADRARVMAGIRRIAALEGLVILGWRDIPHDRARCGRGARQVMPHLAHLFVASSRGERVLALDRRALCLRKPAAHQEATNLAGLSSGPIRLKRVLTAPPLPQCLPRLPP